MDTKKTGELIAEARRAKGLTQEQLAQMLHVNHTTISKWERVECYPDLTFLPALADLLSCSINDFFETTDG